MNQVNGNLGHRPSFRDNNLHHRPSQRDGNLYHRPSHRDGNLSHRPSHAEVLYMEIEEDNGGESFCVSFPSDNNEEIQAGWRHFYEDR